MRVRISSIIASTDETIAFVARKLGLPHANVAVARHNLIHHFGRTAPTSAVILANVTLVLGAIRFPEETRRAIHDVASGQSPVTVFNGIIARNHDLNKPNGPRPKLVNMPNVVQFKDERGQDSVIIDGNAMTYLEARARGLIPQVYVDVQPAGANR